MGTITQDQVNESDQDTTKKSIIDYDPKHFLRCHSKKNDSSDVQTQVWQCAFQPDCNDRRKTTSIVATCGGNSVCFIDVEKGIVPYKYYAKDSSRQEVYAPSKQELKEKWHKLPQSTGLYRNEQQYETSLNETSF